MNENPTTIADVEALAAKVGISLTSDDYAQANTLAEQRRQQLEAQLTSEAQKQGLAALVDQFNRFYPKFLQTLLGIGDVLTTMTQTVLIAFGVPVLLAMVMLVEQQRVHHGMALFEAAGPLASFGATVLVLANLVFELLISWKENQAGYIEPARHEFSFRLLAQRIAYMLGQSTNWQPRPKSPAQRFKMVLRVITFTILVLALAGSMRSVIEQTSGNWADAIRYVLTESTLLQAVTWLGGLLFAVAAVLAAQALSQYVAQKVIEIVAIMQSTADDKPEQIANAAGLTAAMYLYSRLKDTQKTRRLAASASAADLPEANLSGTIRVPSFVTGTSDSTSNWDKSDSDSGYRNGQKPTKTTKIDQAVALLKEDKTLRKLTVRDLESRYPDIRKNTWATAKKRLGF
jgi:hypothetical protein